MSIHKDDSIDLEDAKFDDVKIDDVDFDDGVDDADDPLKGIKYGKLTHIEESKQELTALQIAFREAAKNENKTRTDNTDSEYWFCVCFQNREQKNAFMEKSGWNIEDDKYIDGQELARVMKINLPLAHTKFNLKKTDKKMVSCGLIKE